MGKKEQVPALAIFVQGSLWFTYSCTLYYFCAQAWPWGSRPPLAGKKTGA